jgi:molecular chaperone GrpE
MTEKETMEDVAETDPLETDTTPSSPPPRQPSSQAEVSDNVPSSAEDQTTDDTPTTEPTLEEQLASAERLAQENHERFLRAAAELDNFRKRKEREISDLRKYANQTLLRELLGVVDNLERALAASLESDEPESLMTGVEMTLKELLKIFDQFGVQPIESLQQPFDPNLHEAVMQEASDDVPANTVLRELQKGYLLRDRLLRPAMVVVSKESA